jgi:hypothetical protein
MKQRASRALCLGFALCGLFGSPASAQESYDEPLPPSRKYISSERFAIEFRIGPYQPNMGSNDAFDTFFSGDRGPLFGIELDAIAYRIPDLVYLCAGGRFGSAGWDGKSLDKSGMRTAEDVTLSYLPLDALAVVRIDALARQLSVPLIVTGKLGYEWAHWTTQTGKFAEKSGWSVGLVWGAQLGLDLDTFDRKAARTMDEEWGINHSFLFFELFRFHPSANSLPLGSTAWAAGLGFTF